MYNLSELSLLAKEVSSKARITSLKMTHASGASHIGSALSVIDILATLFVLKKHARDKNYIEDHRIVFSKGHAAAGLYSVLNALGYVSDQDIESYCKNGSKFYGHANHLASPEIELSTGSLGHGLPFGAGLAHGAILRTKPEVKVYVIMSDGECNEGTTWETALLAPQFKLQNLCVVIDRNMIQSLGRTEEVLKLEPLGEKWRNFGWNVQECDGNSIDDLLDKLTSFEGPLCLIANTKKGAGVNFMEDKLEWHYKSPNDSELQDAISEIMDAGK